MPAGSFAADKLEGDGVMYYGNGDIYHGGFKAGKKHGSGQMYFQVCCRVVVVVVGGGDHAKPATHQGRHALGVAAVRMCEACCS